MRTLFAFPSTAIFAQQAALALSERHALEAYFTSFAYQDGSTLAHLVAALPPTIRARILPQLKRRELPNVPQTLIEQRPLWEIIRTAAHKLGADATIVDRIWDHLSHDFTKAAGRRLSPRIGAVYCYEYTAFEAFQAADKRNIAKILDFPSLNSRRFEELQRSEKANFPELGGRHEDYFKARFERRQARRDAEMAAADVIITNSSLTRSSHVEAGADPQKTFAVPYGAPPAISTISPRMTNTPLRVVWAGTFSVRKGAHYFLDAWRSLRARADATADVYGANTLPERLVNPLPQGMHFRGSVIRPVLLEAFEAADILIFPTLSDGFGMVATEAFSRGLPVITTNQAGVADLVVDGENGLLIQAGDSDAIAEALRWCLDHRERLVAMRDAALNTARAWQWSDYRTALIGAVSEGLVRAGYDPEFGHNGSPTTTPSP